MQYLIPKVEEALRKLDVSAPTIEVWSEGTTVMGVVTSPTFDGMDQSDRQSIIWGCLLAELAPMDNALVEFVWTYTPEELTARRAAAAAEAAKA